MDGIIELPGVAGIADDECVYGGTEEQYDKNLTHLMERAQEYSHIFNSEKCTIKQKSITFFGNIYSAVGIHPDPEKANSKEQRRPTDIPWLDLYKSICANIHGESPYIT